MTEIELITKALKDAYNFVKEREQTQETGELLIALFKSEILVNNLLKPDVSGLSEQLIDFAIKNGYIEDMPKGNKTGLIDKFEKSINCH